MSLSDAFFSRFLPKSSIKIMKPIKITSSLCVVLSCLFLISAQGQEVSVEDVSAQDLWNLGALCEPQSTCSNVSVGLNESSYQHSEKWRYYYYNRHCDCDALCLEYKTCCVDSPYRKRSQGHRKRDECITPPGNEFSFFMVNECDPRWIGNPEIREICRNYSVQNPYSLLPAHDPKENVTYKNVFCAICNGVEFASLKMWTMVVHKNLRRRYPEQDLIDYLTYDEESKHWGHWENYDGDWIFLAVGISTKIPEDGLPRFCIKGLIEHCDPAWADGSISRKCHSYMAPIYAVKRNDTSLVRYRNVHCAICNFAELKPDNVCSPKFTSIARPGPGPPGLSFALLIDVNTRHGNLVGRISRCKSGESYDPFFKKCRSLSCGIPGFVLKGDKCVIA